MPKRKLNQDEDCDFDQGTEKALVMISRAVAKGGDGIKRVDFFFFLDERNNIMFAY